MSQYRPMPAPQHFPMPDARPEKLRKAEGERRSPGHFAAYTTGQLQAAYEAGQRAEREACAALCDSTRSLLPEVMSAHLPTTVTELAAEITAFAGMSCAHAIRARSGAQDEGRTTP